MGILGKQKDTRNFLKLGGTYRTDEAGLTFQSRFSDTVALDGRTIVMTNFDRKPNITKVFFAPNSINSFIETSSGQLQPLQLEFNGSSSQIYLRNYDFATGQITSQILITARGEIAGGGFGSENIGTIDLAKGTFNRKIILTEDNVSTISVAKADFDALVARVTALEGAKSMKIQTNKVQPKR